MHSEQYYMHIDPSNGVGDDDLRRAVLRVDRRSSCPVVWKRRWGRGRIFLRVGGPHRSRLQRAGSEEIVRRGMFVAAARAVRHLWLTSNPCRWASSAAVTSAARMRMLKDALPPCRWSPAPICAN